MSTDDVWERLEAAMQELRRSTAWLKETADEIEERWPPDEREPPRLTVIRRGGDGEA